MRSSRLQFHQIFLALHNKDHEMLASSTIGPPEVIKPTPLRCRCNALTIETHLSSRIYPTSAEVLQNLH